MMTKEEFAIVGLRLLATGALITGVFLILGNVLETAWDFNPNYLGHYFSTQLLRPFLLILIGVSLYALSRKIGKIIGKC